MGIRAYFSEDFYYNYEDRSFYENDKFIKKLTKNQSLVLKYLLDNMDIPISSYEIYESINSDYNNIDDKNIDPIRSLNNYITKIKRFNNIEDLPDKSIIEFYNILDSFITASTAGYYADSNFVTIIKDIPSPREEQEKIEEDNLFSDITLENNTDDLLSSNEEQEKIYTIEQYYSNNNVSNNYPVYPSSMIISDDLKQYETYYERVEPLEKIDTIMTSYGDHQRIVIIGGMGGIGKTELARAYAYNHFELTSDHFNVDKTYSNEFLIIYNNDVDELTKDISSALETCISEKTLLIIDNLNVGIEKGFDSIVDTIISASQGADIIITTRNVVISRKYTSSFFNLTKFSYTTDCISIFKNNYELENDFGNTLTLSELEKDLLFEIFNATGNNILFSKLLAIQTRENNGLFTIKDYYETISNRISNIKSAFESGVSIDADGFEHNGHSTDSNPYVILKDILFKDQLTWVKLSDNDIKVLYILSIISPMQMELSAICDHTDLTKIDFKSVHNKLVKQGWINLYPYNDNNIKQHYYDIHPLLAQLFLENINEIIDTDNFKNIINSLLTRILSLNYEALMSERYVFSNLLEKCSESPLKNKANIIYDLMFSQKKSPKQIQHLKYRIKNSIPFIEYDASYIRYAFYDLVKHNTLDIIKIDIMPSHTPIIEDIVLLRPFLNGRKINIMIPDEINNKKITSIPDYWLINYNKNFTVSFSTEIKRIGYKAFCNSSISGELRLPPSLKFIEYEAFAGCKKLSGNLQLPNSVEQLGVGCFANCNRITHVSLSNSLMDIPQYAFAYCDAIRGKLLIPSSVEEVKEDAFLHCSNITEIILENPNTKISENAFRLCKISMSETDYLLQLLNEVLGKDEEAKIDSELTQKYIDFVHPESLNIPDGTTTIKAGTYTQNYRLWDSLSIPESVNTIDAYAFWGCRNIYGNIEFPPTLASIGEGAFNRCEQLSGDLIIPPDITRIENYTFNGCIGINGQLKLPVNLSYIGDYAFSNTSVTGFLVIPPRVEYIGSYAFHFCQNISGPLILPAGINHVKENSFESCSKLNSVIFPSELEIIEKAAFKNCINLKGKLSFPDSLKHLYYEAFSGCHFDGEVVFPDKFEYIDGHALDYTHIDSIVFLNAHTMFPDDYIITSKRNVTIKGYKFSTAEAYASIFGYQFEYLD